MCDDAYVDHVNHGGLGDKALVVQLEQKRLGFGTFLVKQNGRAGRGRKFSRHRFNEIRSSRKPPNKKTTRLHTIFSRGGNDIPFDEIDYRGPLTRCRHSPTPQQIKIIDVDVIPILIVPVGIIIVGDIAVLAR
jgi:hypothetical protein